MTSGVDDTGIRAKTAGPTSRQQEQAKGYRWPVVRHQASECLGMPAKLNAHSGRNPNRIPG